MENLNKMIHWLGHASFRFESSGGHVIYVDPYRLKNPQKKADVILITHDHYDHFSADDIAKILDLKTSIYGPKSLSGRIKNPVNIMKPGDAVTFKDIRIEAVHSYNTDKNFHQKNQDNIGFVVTIDGVRIYHAGDTDFIPEMKNIKADIVLLPVGGTYTMDTMGAVDAVSAINPRVAIPMHYGTVVGSKEDAVRFSNLCTCEVAMLTPEQ